MGFEDKFLSGIDRHRAQAKAERKDQVGSSIDTLVPREHAEAAAHLKKSSIKMGSFQDLYGPETVQRDIAEVERLKREFDANGKAEFNNGHTFEDVRKLSEITESFLLRGINESGWIPHCGAIKTSDFDDYKNGIDLVLEYQRDENPATHIGLGVDITFASSVDKKLRRIKKDIDAGELSRIKYFDSPKSHVRGELRDIPRGVVGFDLETIDRLAQQKTRYGKLLKTDSTRLTTLHQLDMQFRTFMDYAAEIDSPTLAVLTRSSKFLDLLTKYVQQSMPDHSNIIRDSSSVKKLSRGLESFRDL